ncbi:MAG: adenosylcobalamin-dependent ribonucleoside-diphosphate reductase, partial [Saprospiraceae bacterium]
MERYSNSTREVAQDGRRGALMLTLSIKHPDSHLFIDAKKDLTKVTGANISIKILDDFMQAVVDGQEYKQQFPVDAAYPAVEKTIDANSLWKKIVHNAWASAEPGILFWDTVIRESVPDCYSDQGFKTVSTNPCGEIPLCPYDSCRLLAINLYSYVEDQFSANAYFNMDLFREHVSMAQRMMDNIIDLELEKIDQILIKLADDPEATITRQTEVQLWEKIKEKCIQGRRTGIGITGEGDMLAALGLQYGSIAGNEFSVNIHKELAIATYRGSVQMAKERGAFPLYRPEKEEKNPFIQRLAEADPELYQSMRRYGRRNIALLTIAPTGSTSILTQTSSGLEPVFRVSYQRRRKVNPNDRNVNITFTDEVGDSWEDYHVFHHAFEKWLDVNGYDVETTKHLAEKELQEIIVKSPYNKATANDVDWLAKVELQGAVQKWVDHSISVTVNVPNDANEELIGNIYMRAWQSGCKGITVYRDGSRTGVLISKEESKPEQVEFKNHHSPKRPESLDAKVLSFMNEKEKWVAVVGIFQGQPYEIFTGKADDSFSILTQVSEGKVIKRKGDDGRNRYDFQYQDKAGFKVSIEGLSRSFNPEYWNYAKLISGILRHGMPLEDVVDTVENLNMSDENLNTWKNGVARVLRKLIPDGVIPSNKACPSCAEEALVYQEGCLSCKSCGYSKCN